MKVNDIDFLHEHNLEAYEKVKEILKEAPSCAVVQPTGTGKSYIMMKLLDDYKDDWKIVIAPSRDFLNSLESKEAWTSNKTLTLTYTLIGLRSNDIENLLTEYLINPKLVKLIIVDEAHRAGAPKWGAGLQRLIELCENSKIVGLTATPMRYNENRNMIDELFGGRLAQNMNLSEAINRGILPKLSYVVGMHNIDYDLNKIIKEIDISGSRYMSSLIEQYKENWNFDNYFEYTLKKYLNTNIKSGKHIIFVSSISEANRMYNEIEKWFTQIYQDSTIKVYNINSKSSTRSTDTEEFFEPNDEYEIKVALAVNMLNESFHSDEIRSISMFRGTQSLQVYMQQIGRALIANGNAPYIFDFVDNYNSLSQLSNELKSTTFKTFDDKVVKSESIFDKFFDETVWFIKDIEDFKELNNYNSDRPYKHILEMMDKLECEDILEVEEKYKDFFDWSIMMLAKLHLRHSAINNSEFEQTLNEKFGILSDLLNGLGIKWYKLFINWCNNKENLDDTQIKRLKSDFYKVVLLKQLDLKTLKWLSSKGLGTRINKDKKALINLLNKNRCNNFKYQDKLLEIETIAQDENRYIFYRTFELIENNINNINRGKFLSKDFGDAVAYWLYKIYKNEYNELIEDLQLVYDKYDYVITFCHEIKKSKSYISDTNLVNNIDKLLLNTQGYDDIQRPAVEILKYYGIKTYESFKSYIIKTLSLNDSKEYIEKKLKAFVTRQISESKLFEFVADNQRQLDSKLKLEEFSWSKYVMDEYEYINSLTSEILRIKNEYNSKDSGWLNEELGKLNAYVESNKDKKNKSKGIRLTNNKYINLVSNFKDAHLLVDEIEEEYKDEYLKNVELAIDKWREIYGCDTLENNQFAIGCYALTMCSFSRKHIVGKSISIKLSNQITTFLEWLPNSEKLTPEQHYGSLGSTIKLVKILKNETYYLVNLALTKKTRRHFINVSEAYNNGNKINSNQVIELFESLTARDSSVLHNLNYSKTIKEETNILEFCENIMLEYEKCI